MPVSYRSIKIIKFRYDYGSPGILEYYQHKLLDIVQYPDARTELFHNFRYYKIKKILFEIASVNTMLTLSLQGIWERRSLLPADRAGLIPGGGLRPPACCPIPEYPPQVRDYPTRLRSRIYCSGKSVSEYLLKLLLSSTYYLYPLIGKSHSG